MKSCHNHFFKPCTIQKYLTIAAAKVLALALFIPQLYHSETPGCLSHHLQGLAFQNAMAYFKDSFVCFQFLCKFHVTLLCGQFHCFSLSEDYYFFYLPTCGSLLSQDCHTWCRNQILAWCFGMFLINPPDLFSLPLMTSSADVIFGLVAPRNGRGWVWWHQASILRPFWIVEWQTLKAGRVLKGWLVQLLYQCKNYSTAYVIFFSAWILSSKENSLAV